MISGFLSVFFTVVAETLRSIHVHYNDASE